MPSSVASSCLGGGGEERSNQAKQALLTALLVSELFTPTQS